MNINDLVTHYVTFRRTLGEQCIITEKTLRSFCRAVGPDTPVTRIRLDAVAKFLAGTGPITRTWHFKHSALKGFFQFAVSRGHLDQVPLPTELPKCPPTLVPTFTHVKSFAACWTRFRRSVPMPHARSNRHTLRAMVLLMYGAGLRRGEALRLTAGDVDLPNSVLTIRNTKFFKSTAGSHQPGSDEGAERLLHAGGPLPILQRGRPAPSSSADMAKRFTAAHWQSAFKRLRECAGVQRSDGGRFQPRLHDLRHSFAVHRLTEWYRQGADVQRLGVSPLRLPRACQPGAHASLPDHDVRFAAAGRHALRAVRPRGGQSCVTLPCWVRGFAGS